MNCEFYQCGICHCYYNRFNEKIEEKDMPDSWLLDNKLFICEHCFERLRSFEERISKLENIYEQYKETKIKKLKSENELIKKQMSCDILLRRK